MSNRQARAERRLAQRRENRRQRERRDVSLTPEQVEKRMRELGITTDRRSGRDRRK